MTNIPNNQNNQSQAERNRDRAEAGLKALAAYWAIKNPDTLPLDADCEGYETLIDLLTDLRHWASDNCMDYDEADRLADGHFDHELHQEVAELGKNGCAQ
jgi:acyl-CoA synthetase (NDP forming)